MPDISPGKDAALRCGGQSTWAGARDGSTATHTWTNVEKGSSAVRLKANSGGTSYDCGRAYMAFDTSGITVAPSSATLKIYGYSGTDADVIVVKGDTAGTGGPSTDYVAGDFDAIDGLSSGATMAGNATAYSDEISTWDASDHNEITLNAAALADMASGSEFLIVIVSYDHDYVNTAPSNSQTDNAGMYFVSADGADESKRPLISYVAGVAADNKASGISLSGGSLSGSDLSGEM
jgi:hypothetical protein